MRSVELKGPRLVPAPLHQIVTNMQQSSAAARPPFPALRN